MSLPSLPVPPVLSTLFDVVRYRASAASGCADQPAFTYLNDGENVSGALTYAQLDEAARRLAARLQRVTRHGDRVLLVYPPSLDYVVAFYACVYAGVIAVPALPPANLRTLPRLRLMAADAAPALALTFARIGAGIAQMEAADDGKGSDVLTRLRWMATDEEDAGGNRDGADGAAEWTPPVLTPADLVFLQYTSGSTGAPKGVMVAHDNLIANVAMTRQAYDMRAGDTFVFWLPPHHDFGLIGSMIEPVFVGGHSVLFPPAAFVMRPFRWLKLISRFRGRFTGAPNFAFALCVQKIDEEQKRELDLSCLDVAINGAERIRQESVRAFAAAFAACGLRPEVMTPTYGMAETVLIFSASMRKTTGQVARAWSVSKAALESGRAEASDDPHDAIEIVSTGSTHGGLHHIAVADPVTRRARPELRVGEVWLRGPSVARGYWGQDEADRLATFGATLADDEDGEGHAWLRTGDLGFMRDGELYITGRSKEVMIFNGRNVYPQDVEITVEKADPAFRPNGCAAFSLEDGEGARLVLVQEVESRRQPDTAALVARLRADLAERHEVSALAAVLLIKPGRLPRTSSGKIQRGRCRELYLDGAFDCSWSWSADEEARGAADAAPTLPRGATETRLQALWARLFDRADLSTTASFFHLGGHSLLAAQLVAAVRTEFGVALPMRALFDAPTIVALAGVIDAAPAAAPEDDAGAAPSPMPARPCRCRSPNSASGSSTATSPTTPFMRYRWR